MQGINAKTKFIAALAFTGPVSGVAKTSQATVNVKMFNVHLFY